MTDERVHEVTDMLQEDFPSAFPKKPAEKVALKIGIHKDLYSWADSHAVSHREIVKVLYWWCRGRRYQRALARGNRYDLYGDQVGQPVVDLSIL